MESFSTSSNGITYQEYDSPAQRWDVVFTCFEPLNNVTGGIGSYHRLLIEELAKIGKKQLILTRKVNSEWIPPEGAKIFFVDSFKSTKPYNFVGLEHEYFSLHCHFAFEYLFSKGHRFDLVEFSDYGADGFYPLRARAANIYDFGKAVVRLHSPTVMLIEDNGKKHSQVSQYQRDIVDREMSVYDDCDVILYGGDAMRDRILRLAEKFGYNFSRKMEKCPHPYPKHLFNEHLEGHHVQAREKTIDAVIKVNKLARREELAGARFVGLFGRIEDRKGQYQFISGLLKSDQFVDYVKTSDIHFLVAGHNVLDHIGNYRLGDLYSVIYKKGLSNRFHFTGRVSQEVLSDFSHAVSGYVFPSVFENYPNALLEVLPTTKPIAISCHGCMAEITEGFCDVTVFDPHDIDIAGMITFFRKLPDADSQIDAKEFSARVRALEYRQGRMIDYYSRPSISRKVEEKPSPSVGFVVPIYQNWKYLHQTLSSIFPCMQSGDRIVVVDDGSDRHNLSEIQKICDQHQIELLVLPENSGPSAARLCGAKHLDTDLIQFCDADDLLDPTGIEHARRSFVNDPALDMLTGIMSCFQDANHCWVPRNGHIWTAVEAHFAHSGSMFRRSVILRALDHERLPLNEDWLTSLLILAQGGKARMIPAVTYHYRRFDGTRSTQNAALVGGVHQRIVSKAFENWSFRCPTENMRLREILATYTPGPNSSGLVSDAAYYPLRYQLLDSIFFKLIRNPKIERVMIALKRKWLSIRNGSQHV